MYSWFHSQLAVAAVAVTHSHPRPMLTSPKQPLWFHDPGERAHSLDSPNQAQLREVQTHDSNHHQPPQPQPQSNDPAQWTGGCTYHGHRTLQRTRRSTPTHAARSSRQSTMRRTVHLAGTLPPIFHSCVPVNGATHGTCVCVTLSVRRFLRFRCNHTNEGHTTNLIHALAHTMYNQRTSSKQTQHSTI